MPDGKRAGGKLLRNRAYLPDPSSQMNKLVTELALYDIANVAGVAADLSHCNTPIKVGHGLLRGLPTSLGLHNLF